MQLKEHWPLATSTLLIIQVMEMWTELKTEHELFMSGTVCECPSVWGERTNSEKCSVFLDTLDTKDVFNHVQKISNSNQKSK